MSIVAYNKVGNTYKKENLYLCTLITRNDEVFDLLKSQQCDISVDLLINLAETGLITKKEFDIFYETEDGFVRFLNDHTEIYKGDNSDNKGFLENIVSVWDFFEEDDLGEVVDDKGNTMLCLYEVAPMKEYSEYANYTKRL